MIFPVYEDDIYMMREMALDDANDMFEYLRDKDVMRYTASPTHITIEDTKAMIRKLSSSFPDGKGIAWVVVDKQSNKAIGHIGLYYTDVNKMNASVGFIISPAYQNHGIATWALGNCINFGLNQLKVTRIEAKCKSVNVASERVMQKCGMVFLEMKKSPFLVDGIYYDIKTYIISLNKDYIV